MRNIDTCDARNKRVPTNGRVIKRLKLLDGKLLCHRRKSAAAPSKLQIPKRILLTHAPSLFPSGFGGSSALGMRNSLEISITIFAQRVKVFLRLPVASVPLLVS